MLQEHRRSAFLPAFQQNSVPLSPAAAPHYKSPCLRPLDIYQKPTVLPLREIREFVLGGTGKVLNGITEAVP